MRKYILSLAVIMSLIFGSPLIAENAAISNFVGIWKIHVDKTIEETKKSPRYTSKDADIIATYLAKLLEVMRLKFSETEMTYIRNGKETSFPFTVKETGQNSVTIMVKMGNDDATIVLSMREGKLLNFTSSLTDDMNYYVWEKSD